MITLNYLEQNYKRAAISIIQDYTTVVYNKLISQGINVHFTVIDTFDNEDIEGYFESFKKGFIDNKSISIWTGASENTVFDSPIYNHLFRLWHDYTHIINDQGFDFKGEVITAEMQKRDILLHLELDSFGYTLNTQILASVVELIHREVIGQLVNHAITNDFVEDQKHFSEHYYSKLTTI